MSLTIDQRRYLDRVKGDITLSNSEAWDDGDILNLLDIIDALTKAADDWQARTMACDVEWNTRRVFGETGPVCLDEYDMTAIDGIVKYHPDAELKLTVTWNETHKEQTSEPAV